MRSDGNPWSPYDKSAPWKVRVVARLAHILGVEFRVETRHATFDPVPETYPGDGAFGAWHDGKASTSFWPVDDVRVEARPFLYVRTAADRAFSRELHRIMRLPESAWKKDDKAHKALEETKCES